MQQKNSIRKKLDGLLIQVRSAKKQISQLYSLHKQFTFASIVPKKMIEQFLSSKRKIQKNVEQDKQNNPVSINQNSKKKPQGKSDFKLAAMRPAINKSTKQFLEKVNDEDIQIQSKNQQMKDIKANLLLQLSELKCIQRKQQSIRRTNEKMKQYSSSQKKYYRQSISRQKSDTALTNSGASEKSLNIASYASETNTNSLESSQISISIPASIQGKPKTLKCQKGHEFYEGMVNVRDQPHGSGRLQICCSSIPSQIGGSIMKDAQFYQGQFKDGKFNGFGTLSYRGGVKYVGQFREGKRQGKGSLYYNGKAEIAKWQNDVFVSIM